MKSLIHKIISIFLIPVVLFSSSSFSMDKHLCMNTIYSVSIFGEAEDCGMKINTFDEKTSISCTVVEDDCCTHENRVINGKVLIPNNEFELSVEQIDFLTYFIVSKFNLSSSKSNKSDNYKLYSPPKVSKNISVLFQTFII